MSHCERTGENSQLSPQAGGDANNAMMSAFPTKKGRKAKNVSLVRKVDPQSRKIRDATTDPIADVTAANDTQ
jgi:hypothetical protein